MLAVCLQIILFILMIVEAISNLFLSPNTLKDIINFTQPNKKREPITVAGLPRALLLARTLGSWVRIPLEAWMFVLCALIVCVGRGLATG
jgi:hypothetical protein